MTERSGDFVVEAEWHFHYVHKVGRHVREFLEHLRVRQILGAKCTLCGRTYVPPKAYCEVCFVPIEELTEVTPQGVIEAATVVANGNQHEPVVVAYVRLGTATSSLANYLKIPLGDVPDEGYDDRYIEDLQGRVAIGDIVDVVFSEEPNGRITDFWFELTKQ